MVAATLPGGLVARGARFGSNWRWMKFQLPRLLRGALGGALAVGLIAFVAPNSAHAEEPVPPYLRSLNIWRANVGLPPVTDTPAWSPGLREHSNYLIELGALSHQEDLNRPGATPDGARAGAASVIAAWTYSAVRTESNVIAEWIRAPFHSVHLFEPRWQRTAYGEARQSGRVPLDGAAALDVIRGVGAKVRIDRPITFPGDGTTVPLAEFTSEVPDPLTSCPGYTAPAGLPLLAMFPEPILGASAELRMDGNLIPSCLIDQRYTNPDAPSQEIGRALLKQKNAVIVIPRAPLVAGVTYEATVASSGGVLRWSFRFDPSSGPTAGRTIGIGATRKSAAANSGSAKS